MQIDTNSVKTFTNKECNFSYRDSIFKNNLKDQYIITKVHFKLSKTHMNITSYGDVESELNRLNLKAN